MNCKEFRRKWHEWLDGGGEDSGGDGHLAKCSECRRYASRMARLLKVLDELRVETASIVAKTGAALPTRRRHIQRFGWTASRIAAAIVIVMGAGLYFRTILHPSGPDGDASGPPTVSNPIKEVFSTELGVTLRGASSEKFLVVARPTSQVEAQVFWMYPKMKGS